MQLSLTIVIIGETLDTNHIHVITGYAIPYVNQKMCCFNLTEIAH